MLHPGAPGVGEAVSLRQHSQHSQLDPASLYLMLCLLSGFGPYPLQVTRCLTFPAAPAVLELLWNCCEEAGVVPAIWEVAPAVCKVLAPWLGKHVLGILRPPPFLAALSWASRTAPLPAGGLGSGMFSGGCGSMGKSG